MSYKSGGGLAILLAAVMAVQSHSANAADPKAKEPSGPQPPLIYLNQAGYDTPAIKRFTAPTLADGTPFVVKRVSDKAVVVKGTITGSIGDFSELEPRKSGEEFVVEAGGITSVPFAVGHYWIERATYEPSVEFMIGSRHYLGTWTKPCRGSFGWRDDHHFAFEVQSMVAQYISNPAAYDRMERRIKPFKRDGGDKPRWGALEPCSDGAPDIVKLIHWGADVMVTQKVDHAMMKGQLAAFLYGYPAYARHIPRKAYDQVLAYALELWEKPGISIKYPYDETPSTGHNMLALDTKVGSTKGSHPPGHSIHANLYMYEVAKREKLADAQKYLDAAVKQAQWLVKQDWADPMMTKGQRMSEYVTMMGLVMLGLEHPDRKPAGMDAMLEKWVAIMTSRSANMWDFRKLSDDQWTPTGKSVQHWNEPGNVVGFPGITLGIKQIIDAKHHAILDRLAASHLDNMFGRNPTGRAFSYNFSRDVGNIEFNWYSTHKGGIGMLEEVKFVIEGAPKNAHYPYNPEIGNVGWTEGWVNFNTAYNTSLAVMAFEQTRIEVMDAQFKGPIKQSVARQQIGIRLHAPLNFDYQKAEHVDVQVRWAGKEPETVRLTEASADGRYFEGVMATDGVGTLEISYGFGWLGRRTTIEVR